MNNILNVPRWSTSSFGGVAAPSQVELASLGEHLDSCKVGHGRLDAVRHAVQAVHGFAASRFVTTLAVAALLIGISVLVL
jgi:hypothetical protein